MTKNKHLISILCIFFLLLSALLVRLPPFQFVQSKPLTDGGLFYTMTRELILNDFRLPATTHYNNQDIPFAYPPFSFYLTGFISEVLGLDLLTIYLYLPLIFNLFTVPLIFFLSKELLQQTSKAFIASLVFLFSKSSFEWLIMGGGVARSPAYTLFVLMVWLYIIGLRRKSKLFVIFAGIAYGLIFGFHIETGYTATLILILVTFYFSRDRFGFFSFISVALLAMLIYGPFFLQVLNQSGVTPYLYALRSGSFNLGDSLSNLFIFDPFGVSPCLNLAGAITLLGAVILIKKGEWFLPLWVLMIYFLEPRSFDRFTVIAASLIFAFTIFEITGKLFSSNEYLWGIKFANLHNIIAMAFPLTVAIATSLLIRIDLTNLHELDSYDLTAFEWINTNIPDNQVFVVVPHKKWESDSDSEWFPALTKQKSYLTVQGLEWKDSFQSKQEELNEFLLDRYSFGLPVAISNLHSQVDYVYCSTNESDSIENHCPIELEGFESIYNNGNVIIYQDISNSLSHVEEK